VSGVCGLAGAAAAITHNKTHILTELEVGLSSKSAFCSAHQKRSHSFRVATEVLLAVLNQIG